MLCYSNVCVNERHCVDYTNHTADTAAHIKYVPGVIVNIIKSMYLVKKPT